MAVEHTAPARPSHPGWESTSPPASESFIRDVLVGPGAAPRSVVEALIDALAGMGVEHAFGLIGGAIAPFCEALSCSPIELVHCRHEGGAAFAALEASLATGAPSVVVATTGPGITNALTGLAAARSDGGRVLLVSGATSPPQRGRWAFQETGAQGLSLAGALGQGSIFHYAVTVESAAELPEVIRRLASGFERPGGFVAHVALPIAVQAQPTGDAPRLSARSSRPPASDAATIEECAALLAREPFVIWAGFGARHAADAVRELAERAGAPVMCSPRAKGVFPERHPLYLGTTGVGGHETVDRYFQAHRPAHVLVLGSRLGELTSCWQASLAPRESFLHVDVDPEVPGTAYPGVATVGVQAEISAFLRALLQELPARPRAAIRRREAPLGPTLPSLDRHAYGPVRPSRLMDAIQKVVVDGSDAVVLGEAGNSVTWTINALRFDEPGRFRASPSWGSMGHAVAGVVGVAHARRGKAVAVVGDGAMLMNSEVSTAVHLGARAVWVVLNDARYAMIEQGMRAQRMRPADTSIPAADFVMIARGMGADGVHVAHESELEDALREAMAAPGPFVVDVAIDPDETAPFLRRVASLAEQGAGSAPTDDDTTDGLDELE